MNASFKSELMNDCYAVLQVVHLYQELRKVMGDDFMIQDLSSQDPKVSLLPGGRYYQALSPADEQARQRALAENASAVQVRLHSFASS